MDTDKVRKVFDLLEGKYHALYLMYNHMYLLYAELHSLISSGKIKLCFNGYNKMQPSMATLKKVLFTCKATEL